MKRVLLGYGASVVLGMILGLGIASNKFLEETMGGLLGEPSKLTQHLRWPLALLWFGFNQNAILSVVVMGSLLSVTIAMEDRRKQMPKIYGMAGRNLGARGFQLFWYVLLPASLPFIVTWLKQGWAFAWRSLITAEMLYVSLGLGQVLDDEPRDQQHKRRDRSHDSDHHDWVHRRWSGVQDNRKAFAPKTGFSSRMSVIAQEVAHPVVCSGRSHRIAH